MRIGSEFNFDSVKLARFVSRRQRRRRPLELGFRSRLSQDAITITSRQREWDGVLRDCAAAAATAQSDCILKLRSFFERDSDLLVLFVFFSLVFSLQQSNLRGRGRRRRRRRRSTLFCAYCITVYNIVCIYVPYC